VICPFLEFFKRNGRFALIILLFVALFRLSDITMGIMANPFYLDMGYSKSEIASIAKGFGFFMTIAGSALCGIWVVKWGLFRPLLLGAVLVASTNVLFALLAYDQLGLVSPSLVWLAVVISADNLSGGIASTAFVAYLSSLTNRSYTATQYALFSSLMTLPGKFISGFSGVIVDASSYVHFFLIAAGLGVPAIVLVLVLKRREESQQLTDQALG
jgi:PAT family beta-lactamase induction signal transducer AmpG